MSNRTTQVKRTFANTIGAGVRSLFNGNQHYFILEHQGGSNSMAPGFSKQFIVEFVEIGRSKSCNFRFGEADATVSRVHASIHKEDNQYVITHRSETNPTLVNGNYVQDRWFLNNGDTIQLSKTGPKLNFIIPVNNATKTIGMTRRLSLFAQQSLKPIKTLLLVSFLFLTALIFGASYLFKSEIDDSEKRNRQNISETKDNLKTLIDSLESDKSIFNDSLIKVINAQKRSIKPPSVKEINETNELAFNEIQDKFEKDIFIMKAEGLEIISTNGDIHEFDNMSIICTAFLDNDGKLITARHCIEPWYYTQFLFNYRKEGKSFTDLTRINELIQKNGAIDCTYNFYNSEGKLVFSIPYSKFRTDKTSDVTKVEEDYNKKSITLKLVSEPCNDFAFTQVKQKGSIKTNIDLSEKLPLGGKIYSVGYPGAYTAGSSPIYSSNTISYKGLYNDCILITDKNTDSGSSGGPLFVKNGSSFEVIGVVSGGVGNKIGTITPMSAIRNIY